MAIEFNSVFPEQTRSYNEKIKDDFEWVKQSVTAIIQRSLFNDAQHKVWLKRLYDYYNGAVYEEDYNLVTQPFGKKIEGDWSDVKNYPLIKGKVDLLRGEYAKRPKNRMVFVVNDDVKTIKDEEWNKKLLEYANQLFINKLNALGVDTNVDSEPVPELTKLQEEFDSSYRDKRAVHGQRALSFIEQYAKLDEKFDMAFLDWLVGGEVYTYKGVEHNEVVEEIINPLDFDFDKDPDLLFVEDGDWAVRRKYVLPSTINQMFYNDMTTKEVEDVEKLSGQGATFSTIAPYINGRDFRFKGWSRLIEVIHVVWKSKEKIGFVEIPNEFGEIETIEVSEDYKAEAGQKIEWIWRNQVWEAYRIGESMWKRMQPVPQQRGSLDNPAKCKLPYNGRIYSNRNSVNTSLVSIGIPYQILYNATFHRLKLAMAKMKDDMAQLDINLKPANWSIDKWLHMSDLTSIMFVDYSKEGVKLNPTHQTTLKLASQTIGSYTELLRFIKSEWEEVCGISRQREGQIATSETVGGVERAVVQSSLITETYFTLFNQFIKREYEGLLDYSQIAWVNGKKASFVDSELGKLVYLDIDAEYPNAEFGIFVSDTAKDQEKLKMLQNFIQPAMQNGLPLSSAAEVFETESIAQIKTKLKVTEGKMQEYNQSMEQMKQKGQQDQIVLNDQMADKQLERELQLIDRKGEWDLRAKELTALGFDEGDDTADILEQTKLALDEKKHTDTMSMKDKELSMNQYNDDKREASALKLKEMDMQMKEKEMLSKEKIAKQKPKPTKK